MDRTIKADPQKDPLAITRVIDYSRNEGFTGTHIDVIGEGVCDFCGTNSPLYIHKCEPFELKNALVHGEDYADDGEWAACEICHQYVLDKDEEGLFTYSLQQQTKKSYEEPIGLDISFAIRVQREFFKRLTGEWEELRKGG